MGYKFVDGLMSLCVLILWVLVGCTYPVETALDEGERVDWQVMMYESVMAGDVLMCPYADCVVMARFGIGQPLPVIGMMAGDGLWYIIPVDNVEGYVRLDVLVYANRLNVTPTPNVYFTW